MIIMCVWDSLVFLKLAYHSDTFLDQHHKHRRKAWWRAWTLFVSHSLLRTCICDGTTKMQHPEIFGRRHTQVPRLQINEIAGQDLTKVTSKHHPVNQHAIFCWTGHSTGHLPRLHGLLACLHLSLDIFHWFRVCTAVQIDRLPILRHNRGLLRCPPFGVTSGLLWKDVRNLNVSSFKCHHTGQRGSEQRRPTETWVTECSAHKWKVK